MRRPFISLVIFFLLIAEGKTQSPTDGIYRIAKLSLKGNFSFADAQLLQLMSSRPPSLRQRVFNRAELPPYTETLIENDLKQLIRFYRQEGFLDAVAVVAEKRINEKKHTVALVIEVIEGMPVKVESVTTDFDLQEEKSQAAFLRSHTHAVLQLRPGRRFRDKSFYGDVERLQQALADLGYPYAHVDHRLAVDKERHRVSTYYTITLGPSCVFGEVILDGREKNDPLVLHQLAFSPGQTFAKKNLDRTQRRLYALNVFEFVTVRALLPNPPQPEIPVEIRVRPAPRTTVKAGIGYGREESLRAFVSLQRLSFLGGARRLDLQVKHSELEPYVLDLRLVQPAFLRPTASLGVNPFMRSQFEPAFRLSRNGINLFYQESIGETMSAGLTYIFEQVDLDLNSLAAPRATEELRGLYNKSSLLLAVSKNTTDDLFAPNEGTRFTLSAKYSGLGAGEYHYSKWLMDIRRYRRQLGGVGAVRISVGKIDSFDPIKVVPVEDLFFAGGANSIRGWGRYELGPRAGDGKPLGGTVIFEASLEARLPLWRFLQSALFIDAGNVFIDRLDILDSRVAVGSGLRLKTPVGPVRLDLARPIFESGTLRWHLSVGEAF